MIMYVQGVNCPECQQDVGRQHVQGCYTAQRFMLMDEVARLRHALNGASIAFDSIVGTFADRQAFVMQGPRAFASIEQLARYGALTCKAALAPWGDRMETKETE